jgi:hypothetical protein
MHIIIPFRDLKNAKHYQLHTKNLGVLLVVQIHKNINIHKYFIPHICMSPKKINQSNRMGAKFRSRSIVARR